MDLLPFNEKYHFNCLSSIGVRIGDTYKPGENCIDALKEIYDHLLAEDCASRSFRRALHFSRTCENDLVPLLLQTDKPEIMEAIIKILACLLCPIECFMPAELSNTQSGKVILHELKCFLTQSKPLFCEPKSTLVILEFITSLNQLGEETALTKLECESINDCLLTLRNILHLPDSQKDLQNVILRNLFVQNVDQILLHLMTHKNKEYWSVAIVQLVAVMYKDQHVGTLQKHLKIWFERSLCESSEDNESNTTLDPGNTSSSFNTSSEPSSDSSESGAGVRAKIDDNYQQQRSSVPPRSPTKTLQPEKPASQCNRTRKSPKGGAVDRNPSGQVEEPSELRQKGHHTVSNPANKQVTQHNRPRKTTAVKKDKVMLEDTTKCCEVVSLDVDFGYASHQDIPGTGSTSSKEDESSPPKRQKPHIQKTRYSRKQPSLQEKEARRKTIIRRRKNTLKNKTSANFSPRDEDITNLLAEFTVDFLTTGYEPLVSALLNELLRPSCGPPLDTSHFFWLLTYFLKFPWQLELNMGQIRGVLSFRVLAYLVYQGVQISEKVEEALLSNGEVKLLLRRQHLVVTSIREFILSLDAYQKVVYITPQDKENLRDLFSTIRSCQDLRCLFVLLLRLFRQETHSRQYLEDLVVTNHVLLTFLEKHLEFGGEFSMTDHLQQFARKEIMRNYGVVLEDFQSNGEYLNDCVFTMMHHVGGEINQVVCLYQPNILKIFTKIWECDVHLCEDWSDLIEFVIHQFVAFSNKSPVTGLVCSSELEKDKFLGAHSDKGNIEARSTANKANVSSTQENAMENVKKAQNDFKKAILWLQRTLLEARDAKLAVSESGPLGVKSNCFSIAYHCAIMNESIPLVTWNCTLADTLTHKSFTRFLLGHGFLQPLGTYFFHIPTTWTPDDLLIVATKLDSIDSAKLTRQTTNQMGPPLSLNEPTSMDFNVVQPFTMPRAKNTTSMVNQTPVPHLPTSWLNVVSKSKMTTQKDFGSSTKELPPQLSVNNAMVIIERTPQPPKLSIGGCFDTESTATTMDDVKDEEVDGREKSTRWAHIGGCQEHKEGDDIECASVVSLCNSHMSEVTRMCISDEEADQSHQIADDLW